MSEGWKLISEKIYKKERILKTDLLINKIDHLVVSRSLPPL